MQEPDAPFQRSDQRTAAGTTISGRDVARIALRLRISVPHVDDPKRGLRTVLAQRAAESARGRWDILDAIDYVGSST